MKATTILKLIERALNPDLKEAHIKAYAEAMIEKDRIDAANNFQPRCITQEGQLKQMQSIVNRPIILD